MGFSCTVLENIVQHHYWEELRREQERKLEQKKSVYLLSVTLQFFTELHQRELLAWEEEHRGKGWGWG